MEEDIKILEKAIKVLTGNDTGIKLDFEKTAQAIKNLIQRNNDLLEIEKEHQKQIGELIIENNKLKEDLLGKSIQELGTSDFYMKEIEKHIPRIY